MGEKDCDNNPRFRKEKKGRGIGMADDYIITYLYYYSICEFMYVRLTPDLCGGRLY